MLVEKFDFIELLRLAIAQGKAEGKKISKDVVLGELALLSPAAKLWATVLIEKVDFERIAIITPAQKQTETFTVSMTLIFKLNAVLKIFRARLSLFVVRLNQVIFSEREIN